MLSLLRPSSLRRMVRIPSASPRRRFCSATDGVEQPRAIIEKHRTPTQGEWPRVLAVRLPCSVRVGPVDAMDADAVSVALVGLPPEQRPESSPRPTLKIDREGDSLTLRMAGADRENLDGLLCSVRLPAMLSVEVHLSGKARATLENVVLDQCIVATEGGDIALRSVKTNKAELSTVDGWIRSKSLLQGHLSLIARGSGGVEAQRLVGTSLEVSTSSGDQTVAAAYMEKARMVSAGGNLRLGTLHSSSAALKTSSGCVSLGGLDGDCSVTTDTGDIHVVVARTQNLDVDTNTGDVNMLLSSPHRVSVDAESVSSSLDASMTQVDPSGDVGRIAIRSRVGTVSLGKQDWVSSLNLGKRGSS